jgi:hypothetical protein
MTKKRTGSWSADQMYELGTRHAMLEAEGDLEGVMATVVPDPIYDFWPVGLRATGQDAIRRYYRHLIDVFMPSQRGFTLVEEWRSERSLAQEYRIDIKATGPNAGPDDTIVYQVIGILFERDGLIGGERIWASEECLRAMIGPLYDELEPITSGPYSSD